jgi:MFS transporter, DHA3 family, macrolide efflux protein
VVQMISGLGLLISSVAVSATGGPRRRVQAIIGSLALAGVGLMLIGLRPSIVFAGSGFFLMMLMIPLASAMSQALFQLKVAPDVQGRIFAMRNMISRSMMPLAFVASGLLADHVFEPLMQPGGALAATALATIYGVGPGRGIGLMFGIAGLVLLIVSLLALASRRLRRLENELPDFVATPPEDNAGPSATLPPAVAG